MPQFVIERDVPGAHLMSEAEVREAVDRVGPYAGAVQVYLARR